MVDEASETSIKEQICTRLQLYSGQCQRTVGKGVISFSLFSGGLFMARKGGN